MRFQFFRNSGFRFNTYKYRKKATIENEEEGDEDVKTIEVEREVDKSNDYKFFEKIRFLDSLIGNLSYYFSFKFTHLLEKTENLKRPRTAIYENSSVSYYLEKLIQAERGITRALENYETKTRKKAKVLEESDAEDSCYDNTAKTDFQSEIINDYQLKFQGNASPKKLQLKLNTVLLSPQIKLKEKAVSGISHNPNSLFYESRRSASTTIQSERNSKYFYIQKIPLYTTIPSFPPSFQPQNTNNTQKHTQPQQLHLNAQSKRNSALLQPNAIANSTKASKVSTPNEIAQPSKTSDNFFSKLPHLEEKYASFKQTQKEKNKSIQFEKEEKDKIARLLSQTERQQQTEGETEQGRVKGRASDVGNWKENKENLNKDLDLSQENPANENKAVKDTNGILNQSQENCSVKKHIRTSSEMTEQPFDISKTDFSDLKSIFSTETKEGLANNLSHIEEIMSSENVDLSYACKHEKRKSALFNSSNEYLSNLANDSELNPFSLSSINSEYIFKSTYNQHRPTTTDGTLPKRVHPPLPDSAKQTQCGGGNLGTKINHPKRQILLNKQKEMSVQNDVIAENKTHIIVKKNSITEKRTGKKDSQDTASILPSSLLDHSSNIPNKKVFSNYTTPNRHCVCKYENCVSLMKTKILRENEDLSISKLGGKKLGSLIKIEMKNKDRFQGRRMDTEFTKEVGRYSKSSTTTPLRKYRARAQRIQKPESSQTGQHIDQQQRACTASGLHHKANALHNARNLTAVPIPSHIPPDLPFQRPITTSTGIRTTRVQPDPAISTLESAKTYVSKACDGSDSFQNVQNRAFFRAECFKNDSFKIIQPRKICSRERSIQAQTSNSLAGNSSSSTHNNVSQNYSNSVQRDRVVKSSIGVNRNVNRHMHPVKKVSETIGTSRNHISPSKSPHTSEIVLNFKIFPPHKLSMADFQCEGKTFDQRIMLNPKLERRIGLDDTFDQRKKNRLGFPKERNCRTAKTAYRNIHRPIYTHSNTQRKNS
jgi:hypothetical protein